MDIRKTTDKVFDDLESQKPHTIIVEITFQVPDGVDFNEDKAVATFNEVYGDATFRLFPLREVIDAAIEERYWETKVEQYVSE